MTTKPFEFNETRDPEGRTGTEPPIDFSRNREERRAGRLNRRNLRRPHEEGEGFDAEAAESPDIRRAKPGIITDVDAAQRRKSSLISWTALSFLLMVLVPATALGTYYNWIASPQYQVETQFSVRGSSQQNVSALGLGAILGNSVQSSDSYIVASYVESMQLIRDVQDQLGIDLRKFYSRDEIDFAYRIKPDMPIEEFAEYWRDLNEVSFNSTTGNVTLYIYAFSAEDSKAIADAVLKVSEKLVNTLSESSRRQLTVVASNQVERAEDRLRTVREDIRKLRIEERAFDPAQIAAVENTLTQTIESQLLGLKTRLSTLRQSVSDDSPSAKVILRQIASLEQQLVLQKAKLGQPNGVAAAKNTSDDETSLAEVMTKFEELNVELGFATQAYTLALASLESSVSEAQKQELYFATFVLPAKPQIALYPQRILDSFIGFLVLMAFWLLSQFIYRSFRDHAI